MYGNSSGSFSKLRVSRFLQNAIRSATPLKVNYYIDKVQDNNFKNFYYWK